MSSEIFKALSHGKDWKQMHYRIPRVKKKNIAKKFYYVKFENRMEAFSKFLADKFCQWSLFFISMYSYIPSQHSIVQSQQ